MKTLILAIVSVALLAGIAGTADAAKRKKYRSYDTYYYSNSPSAIAARQRDARTFDETQYFERDSNRIPFGTAEWWRQKLRENPGIAR
jgi:hypothetical protein